MWPGVSMTRNVIEPRSIMLSSPTVRSMQVICLIHISVCAVKLCGIVVHFTDDCACGGLFEYFLCICTADNHNVRPLFLQVCAAGSMVVMGVREQCVIEGAGLSALP